MLIELNKGQNKISGVYRIINLLNDRVYIGSTVGFRRRMKHHVSRLILGCHGNIFLQRDFTKCGSDNFLFEIVEVVLDRENLLTREQYYLDMFFGKNCYNILPRAGSNLGRKHTEETKEKIRNKMAGRKLSAERCEILSQCHKGLPGTMLGKKHTEESKAKMSASTKNCSMETRARISSSNKGRKHSKDTIEKIKASNKGKKHSAEARAKMSAAQNRRVQEGMVQTEEHKRKNSEANKGKRHSNETKLKMSIARKELWNNEDFKSKNRDKGARDYVAVDPKGTIVKIHNLTAFCKENNLSQSAMSLVLNGGKRKRKQHKGWTKYIEPIEPVSFKEENT